MLIPCCSRVIYGNTAMHLCYTCWAAILIGLQSRDTEISERQLEQNIYITQALGKGEENDLNSFTSETVLKQLFHLCK